MSLLFVIPVKLICMSIFEILGTESCLKFIEVTLDVNDCKLNITLKVLQNRECSKVDVVEVREEA